MLNTTLIRQRRLELGLTQLGLARRLGLSQPALAAIEHGTNHDTLKLHHVSDLAHALALSPADLLRADQDRPMPHSDDITLEAALLAVRGRRTVTHLAAVFSWPHSRVESAADTLQRRLEGTGATLARTSLGLQLQPRPGVLTVEMPNAQTARRHTTTRNLSTTEAQLLRRAITQGGLSQDAVYSNPVRVAVAALLKRHLLTPDTSGSLRPSDDAQQTFEAATPITRGRSRRTPHSTVPEAEPAGGQRGRRKSSNP